MHTETSYLFGCWPLEDNSWVGIDVNFMSKLHLFFSHQFFIFWGKKKDLIKRKREREREREKRRLVCREWTSKKIFQAKGQFLRPLVQY